MLYNSYTNIIQLFYEFVQTLNTLIIKRGVGGCYAQKNTMDKGMYIHAFIHDILVYFFNYNIFLLGTILGFLIGTIGKADSHFALTIQNPLYCQ